MRNMDTTLAQALSDQTGRKGFRLEFVNSTFCQTTHLGDVLSDPESVLQALSTAPGIGAVSEARLRQFLVKTFSTAFAQEWAAAHEALSLGKEPQCPRVRELMNFITVWEVVEDVVPVSIRFHPDYDLGSNRVMLESLARPDPFIYACESFPEVLKTPQVLFAEQGNDSQKAEYSQHLSGLRDSLPSLAAGSVVLLPERPLCDLRDGDGGYCDLPEADRAAQFAILLGFAKAMPHVATCVVNYRKIGLSSGFQSGDGPLLFYCFGGYAEVTTPEMVRIFRDKVAQAQKTGISLPEWAEQNAGHKVLRAALENLGVNLAPSE